MFTNQSLTDLVQFENLKKRTMPNFETAHRIIKILLVLQLISACHAVSGI